jgi:hypothetical protein
LPSLIFLLLTTAGACLVMSLVPALAWIAGIAWGIALLLGGRQVDRRLLTLTMVLNVLLLFGLSGNSNLFFIMFLGLPAYVMGLLHNAGRGYYEILKWGLIAALFQVGLFWGLSQSGLAAAHIWDQSGLESYVAESLQAAEETGLIEVYVEQGYSRQELQVAVELSARWLYMHQPALYIIVIMFGLWLILRLSAWLNLRQGSDSLKPDPFRQEIMPWQMSYLVVLALTLWLLGRDRLDSVYYLGSNLLAVMVFVAGYYGLANLTFQLSRLPVAGRRWLWGLFALLALTFTPLVVIFISLWGLFDSLLDYRKINRI